LQTSRRRCVSEQSGGGRHFTQSCEDGTRMPVGSADELNTLSYDKITTPQIVRSKVKLDGTTSGPWHEVRLPRHPGQSAGTRLMAVQRTRDWCRESSDWSAAATWPTDVVASSLISHNQRVDYSHARAPSIGKGFQAMAMSVCSSLCLSSITHMWGLYKNYQTNHREHLGQCWDHDIRYYWIQYCDVITNPRWRTTINVKIVMSAYVRVKMIRLWRNLVHWLTVLKMIWPKSNFKIQDSGRSP